MLSLSAGAGVPVKALASADSLLRAGLPTQAAAAYTALTGAQPAAGLWFRLAFAHEQQGNPASALWALRQAYEAYPDRAILRQMDALAVAYRIPGHEYGDRRFFLTLLRRYYQRLVETGLFVGVLLATFLVLRLRRYPLRRPWAGALLAYVALGALVVNLLSPDRLNREVIVRRPAALMSGPGAGARWLTTLVPGQQLPLAEPTRRDVWQAVKWQNRRAWLRTGDLFP